MFAALKRRKLSQFLTIGGVAVALTAYASTFSSTTSAAPAQGGSAAQALAKAKSILNQIKGGGSINYKGSSGKTIGVMIPATNNEGYDGMYLGVLQQAILHHVSIITQSANQNPVTGANLLSSFLTQGVNAIVLDAFDSAAFVPAVNQANAKGTPVVAYDQSPVAGKLLGSYTSNNVQVGAGEADLVVQFAKSAHKAPSSLKILELYGALTSSAGVDRKKGFDTEAKKRGLTIVDELPTNWLESKASSDVQDAFAAHPTIDTVVMGSGCALWQGTSAGLRTAGKLKPAGQSGHINVFSIDGCSETLAGIRQNLIYGDSTQKLYLIGQKAGALASAAALGQHPKGETIAYPPLLVTKANVNSPLNWANVLTGFKG